MLVMKWLKEEVNKKPNKKVSKNTFFKRYFLIGRIGLTELAIDDNLVYIIIEGLFLL